MVENKKPSFIGNFFKSIGKFFLYVIFWVYFVTALSFAKDWAKISWYHNVPNHNLPFSIQYQRSQGDSKEALFIFSHRKKAEYKESLDVILPLAPELEPLFYLVFARNYDHLGNKDEATFWALMTMFRISYDAHRCMDGRKNIKEIRKIISEFSLTSNVKGYLDDDSSDSYIATMERVLKWDEENPVQHSPKYYCDMISKGNSEIDSDLTPEENWPIYMDGLRKVTQLRIEELKSKKENK